MADNMRCKVCGYSDDERKVFGACPSCRHLVQGRTRIAILKGELIRPDSCQQCGSSEYTPNAHHSDYRYTHEVDWLCPKCHKNLHMRETTNATT